VKQGFDLQGSEQIVRAFEFLLEDEVGFTAWFWLSTALTFCSSSDTLQRENPSILKSILE